MATAIVQVEVRCSLTSFANLAACSTRSRTGRAVKRGGTTGAASHRQAVLRRARPRVNTSPEPGRPNPPASTRSPVLVAHKARTRVVRVAEYVEYSGPKALLTLTRVATLMCDPTTHTHPSSKQVELVTTHEYSEYSLSGGNRLFSRRRLRSSAGSCALHNYMVRPSYLTHARRRRGLRGKRRCRQVAT